MFFRSPIRHQKQEHHYSSDEDANLICLRALTDVFDDFDVKLASDQKILIETVVASDGVGDLIHQINVYECLNRLFPGQIVCRTILGPATKPDPVVALAKEYHFFDKTSFSDQFDMTGVVLRVLVSFRNRDSVNVDGVRTFELMEFRNDSEQLDYWWKRNEVDFFGLLPRAEGIWVDYSLQDLNQSELLLNASDDFKNMLNCQHCQDPHQMQAWLNEAWISQSHSYGYSGFLVTFFAQLEYLQQSRPEVKHCIMKYFGKPRQGDPWAPLLENFLKSHDAKYYLEKYRVRSIYFNKKMIIVDETINGLDLYLINPRLNTEDYSLFQKITNGCIIPSGDNTYCEAWSNANTSLPPFLDLRTYKQSTLNSISRFDASLALSQEEKLWLMKLNQLNREFCDLDLVNTDNSIAHLMEFSKRLADLWSENKNPKATWAIMHKALQEHDIAKRLPAIVKEQLMFAFHPDLADKKSDIVKDPVKSLEVKIEEYTQAIEEKLKPPDSPANTQATQTPLIYTRSQATPLEAQAALFNQLTDLVGNVKLPFPADKKILIETTVLDDGVGDLIHHIRVYQVLNQLYPGQILSRTKIPGLNVDPIKQAAADYHFVCHEDLPPDTVNNIVLHLTISYVMETMALHPKEARRYDLSEFSDSSGWNPHIETWIAGEHFGLLPNGQGIWYDNVPRFLNKLELINTASEKLKKAFWFLPETDLQTWLDQAWISESHLSGKNKFLIALLGQLFYLKQNMPKIRSCVIKFNAKNRDNQGWYQDLIDILKKAEVLELLKSLSISTIVHEDHLGNPITYPIAPDANGIDLYLVNRRLESKDYAAFKQLLNGMIFPAGDNSYFESLSNGNAYFPPLMDLRDYKLNLIKDLISVITALNIPDPEKGWLKSFFTFTREFSTLITDGDKHHYAPDLDFKTIVKHAETLGTLLSENPHLAHSAWQAMHTELGNHDLSKRLPAIVKEQLLFAQFPELIQLKLDLMNNKTLSVQDKLDEYSKAIHQKLKPSGSPVNKK